MQTIAKLALLLLPEVAHAQYVPVELAAAALSPLFVLFLAVVLGFVTRSWRVGARHAGLVLLWVFLFAVAARTVEYDYVIWTPIVLYVAHASYMLFLIVVKVGRKIRTR